VLNFISKILSTILSITDFLQKSEYIPVIDVRSPAEFEAGHIEGAINLPIFSNDERAKVGTLYKQKGKNEAVILGLELVGVKLANFSLTALSLAKEKQLLVYCWRGGMRSASMAWLFETVGIETFILSGGYKTFRNQVIETFDKIEKLVVLGGYTGSGKTEILAQIRQEGEQVLDLEKIAHHKGSTFGALGETENQPTSEHFANLLFHKLQKFDFQKPIWVEDESKRIGTIHLPDNFFEKLRTSFLVKLNLSLNYRIERLIIDYGHFEKELLVSAIHRISKRLGDKDSNLAIAAINSDNLPEAVAISLNYYDKTYDFGLEKREKELVKEINLISDKKENFAKQIIEFYKKVSI